MARGNVRIEIVLSPEVRQGLDRLTELVERIGAAASGSAEAVQSVGVRLSGLSTVEIIPTDAIAALNAKAEAHAHPTACHRCLYHSGSPYLACTVHPKGRPGAVCGDWVAAASKFSPEVQWAVDMLADEGEPIGH